MAGIGMGYVGGGGSKAVTVQTPARDRIVPAWVVQMYNSSVSTHDPNAPWTGSFGKYNVPISVNATALFMATYQSSVVSVAGERIPGGGDASDIRYNNKIQGAIKRAGTNLGSFTWVDAGADPVSDMSFNLSSALVVSATEGETLQANWGCYKFDTSINSLRSYLILNTHSNLGANRNVTTDVNGTVTAGGTDSGTDASVNGDPILLRTTNTTRRFVVISGSSKASPGSGWTAGNQQSGLPLSVNADAATSPAEIACRQNGLGSGQNGMVWWNTAESGSCQQQRFPTSFSQSAFRPQGYRMRNALMQQVDFTDEIISLWVNEFGNAFGFNGIWVSADTSAHDLFWEQIFTQAIKANIARNRRTWFLIEGLQTDWTGGGTNWDATLTAAAYRDAQTPSKGSFINPGIARAKCLEVADRVCKREGSAWAIDTAKFTHALNVRGESVWDLKTSSIQPTADGTHELHSSAYLVGNGVATYFGTRDQASGFPSFGLVN
jgi:hypothetical protein